MTGACIVVMCSYFQCRDDEIKDLDNLRYHTIYNTKGELSNTHTKVNILMQAAISRASSECHSLSSDLMYILQVRCTLPAGTHSNLSVYLSERVPSYSWSV